MISTSLLDACKLIQDNWDCIKRDFFVLVPNHYLEITTVYRSPDEQFQLFQRGRTMNTQGEWIITDKSKIVTNVDGYKEIGAHNYHPSRAIDVCVVNNQTGERLWSNIWYTSLIDIAGRYGLEDGGAWHGLKDWPHLQVRDFKNYRGM